MANKETKPTPAAKPAATGKSASAKPTANVKQTAPAAKTSGIAGSAANKQPAAKSAASSAKPSAAAPKSSGIAGSAAAKQPAAKPAAQPAPAKKATIIDASPKGKPATSATAKPAATVKPVAETKAAAKPAAQPAQPAPAKPAAQSAAQPAVTQVKKPAAAAAVTAPKDAVKPKTTKQPKANKAKQKKSSGGKAQAVAFVKNNKIRIIAIAAVAFVCILALILGLAFGLKSCSHSSNRNPVSELARYDAETYKTNTKVLYSAEVTGTVDSVKPVEEVKDERAAFDSAATGSIFADDAKRYPTYGSTLRSVIGTADEQVAARNVIISESGYLCAWGTAGANRGGEQTPDKYTRIDKDGYLYQYKNDEWIHSLLWGKTADEYTEANYRRLYEHTAAYGMYMEGWTRNGVTYEVSDDAPRVVKEVNMRTRCNGYGITGLYAPAGEVVKVEISGADMNKTGGLQVHIGQALYNGQANNIWAAKNNMIRFPYILTTLFLNKTTCDYDEATDTWTGYIGSFIGGPIYIQNNSKDYTVKFSGGVEYLHFILGYTTEAEFNRLKTNSRVPMFDLEVWDRGVLLSGPRYYAEPFTYEDIYKVAVLWDKVSTVTTYNNNQGIVFLFDPFVAAGAAVAFPGRSSVNNPAGWMADALNYNGLVTSGSWGNFHEYHHNFQNYGLGGADGEVTNNGLNLVSYSLFTKISANRGIGSYGGAGLGGWNSYTSATWALQRVNNGAITDTNGLAIYATMLHNFGQDAYIKARGARGVNYLNRWQDLTHQDFSYYASKITPYVNLTPAATQYPLFVPVSSVYQTGRSYMYDNEKRDIKTMQPYVIPFGDEFTVDLRPYTAPGGQYDSGSIIIGDGFTYKITGVTQPSNGKLVETDVEGVYKYIPSGNSKQLLSGQIRVTLEITTTAGSHEWNGHALDDVDLILEFQQTHETNKMVIQRTTYTYSPEKMYTEAVDAYENGFAGYTDEPVTQNQYNPLQNCNTDIWFRPDTEQFHNQYPNDPDKYFIHDNQIEVLDGKLYFASDGAYRIYLRGRNSCAVYYSLDGKSYALGGKITHSTNITVNGKRDQFLVNNPETYFDVKFEGGKVYVKSGTETDFPKTPAYTITPNSNKKIENWVYVKEVLLCEQTPYVSYIGLGTGQWVQTMFTMEETYHKADGTTVSGPDADDYAYTKTTYKNQVGAEVGYTRKDKNSKTTQYYGKVGNSYVPATEEDFAKLTESKFIEPTAATYVNAYRSTYEFPDNTGFKTEYFYVRSYDYNYTDNIWQNQTQELLETNYAANISWNINSFPLKNLTDGNRNTFIHTKNGYGASESKPLTILMDMGEEKPVNRMVIYSQNRPNGDWHVAKNFKLEGSLNGLEFFTVGEFTNVPRVGTSVTVNFEETSFRYYRLTITGSYNSYIIIGEIELWRAFEINGGKQISTDNAMFNYNGTWNGAATTSTFGHVIVGNKNSSVTFEFEGTRLGVLSSSAYGKDFQVIIDGKVVNSVDLKEDTSATSLTYLSKELESGKHTVTIKCTDEANLDSIVIYP